MATCCYTRDPTSFLVESLMVSRKALQCRMEPRRNHKDTVVTSVVSNVEDGTRLSGGQLGTRDSCLHALCMVDKFDRTPLCVFRDFDSSTNSTYCLMRSRMNLYHQTMSTMERFTPCLWIPLFSDTNGRQTTVMIGERANCLTLPGKVSTGASGGRFWRQLFASHSNCQKG